MHSIIYKLLYSFSLFISLELSASSGQSRVWINQPVLIWWRKNWFCILPVFCQEAGHLYTVYRGLEHRLCCQEKDSDAEESKICAVNTSGFQVVASLYFFKIYRLLHIRIALRIILGLFYLIDGFSSGFYFNTLQPELLMSIHRI